MEVDGARCLRETNKVSRFCSGQQPFAACTPLCTPGYATYLSDVVAGQLCKEKEGSSQPSPKLDVLMLLLQ